MPLKKVYGLRFTVRRLILAFLIVFFLLPLTVNYEPITVFADEVEDLQKQIDELNRARELSVKATSPLEGQLNTLKFQLARIQQGLRNLSAGITQKSEELKTREEKLVMQQALLNSRVRSYYVRSYLTTPFLVILSQSGSAELTREMSYREAAARGDQRVIAQVTADMVDLMEQKEKLEKDKANLASLQEQVDKNTVFLSGEIKKAKEYQADLSSKIAQLSARQQQIIAQKLGSLNLPTSLGAGPLYCTDDRKLDPGFRPAFAFFTFGIPHRVGMNQYGALGRAQAGQGYQDILRAYFDGINFEKKGNLNIKVQGYGEMPIEQYLLGIYEMPGNWPMAALKAQVISARSYALAYTDNGAKEICTTQACQVYKGGNKGGDWERAVRETEGEVMTRDGQVITAWYASTSGGYTFTSADVGWNNRSWTKRLRDTNGDVGNFSDLTSKAYDKDSPCFYAAQGFRPEYAKSAWLKSEELADIVNVILLVRRDSGTREHLYQPDKGNPAGQENWDAGRVKQELKARGGTPFSGISEVSISADLGTGITNTVTVSGDGGSESFNGSEFKNFFNLRAPANLQIVGPLFNAEKK